MANDSELNKLRKSFAEICEKYSLYFYNDKNIYIKHFSVSDDLGIEFYYSNKYDKLLKQGIFTEKDKLKYLIDNNLWDAKNEDKIKLSQETLIDLYKNKSKVYRFSDIEDYKIQIKENEDFLNKLLIERSILLGDTCESLSRKSADLLLIQRSFFTNKECTIPMYSAEEFNNLTNDETDELYKLYYKSLDDLNEKNIKKIVTQPFFNNMFYLSADSTDFFGACITKLTHYQVKLLTWAGYFKTILQNNSIPEVISNDPEEIENWFNGKRNIESVIQNNTNSEGVVSIMASEKEMEFYGVTDPAARAQKQKMHKEFAKTESGEISMEDAMKLGLV